MQLKVSSIRRHLGVLIPKAAPDPIRQQIPMGTDCGPFAAATSEHFSEGGLSPCQRLWRWVLAWLEFYRLGDPGLPKASLQVCSVHMQYAQARVAKDRL